MVEIDDRMERGFQKIIRALRGVELRSPRSAQVKDTYSIEAVGLLAEYIITLNDIRAWNQRHHIQFEMTNMAEAGNRGMVKTEVGYIMF